MSSAEDDRRTSSSLLERVRSNDAQAWQCLVDIYAALIYRWCRQWGLQPVDAADIGQEVLIAVAKNIAGFDHRFCGGFRGWLKVIALNKVRDFARAKDQRATAVGGSDALHRLAHLASGVDEGSESPEDIESDHQLIVRNAFAVVKDEFETSTWQAFWRTVIEGQPSADVAAALAITRNAVYLARSRILRRMRMELRGLYELDTAERFRPPIKDGDSP